MQLKYKILIKYTSVLDKTYYSFYMTEDGEEYSTVNLNELYEVIQALDLKYGHENIRVVTDVKYDVNVYIGEDYVYDTTTSEDIDNIYNSAFEEIFGKAAT